MKTSLFGGFLLALGLGAFGCGGGSTSGAKPCTSQEKELEECGVGFICQDGHCAKVECTKDEDCGAGDRICREIPQAGFEAGKFYCTHLQCRVGDESSCGQGMVCENGLCVYKGGEDTGGSDAVEGADVVQDWGTDTTSPPKPSVSCKPCTGASDCGEGAACAPLAGQKYCLTECSSDADCAGGYICYQVIQPGPKHCVPVSYKCVECAYNGCPEGKCCDLVTGDCKDCVAECGKCTYDFECSKGFRCYKKPQTPTGVCVAECGPTGTCADPSKFSCGDNGKGVKVCIPVNDQACQACPPDKPYALPDGTCVQCLNSLHCGSNEVCDQTSHTCQSSECPTGSKKCSDGQCHQCCVDSDCQGLPGATGKCINYTCEGATDPCGNTCAEPYPVCANVGGTWQCVQCATDADCSMVPNCKCGNYICVDKTTGQTCATTSTCGVKCNDSSECPPGQSGETLECNTQFHVCYNPAGGCDGVTACCGPGQQCVDLLMLLFGGGMGIPGLPGGTTTGMGYCSCNTQADCLGGEPCTPMAILCAIPFIKDIVCPNGQLPSTVPQNMCFDISKLLGGFGF